MIIKMTIKPSLPHCKLFLTMTSKVKSKGKATTLTMKKRVRESSRQPLSMWRGSYAEGLTMTVREMAQKMEMNRWLWN